MSKAKSKASKEVIKASVKKSQQSVQFKDNRPETVQQLKQQELADKFSEGKSNPVQKKKNNTGMPDNLKQGVEQLSGHSMDDVKVHYNSDKPSKLNAHAYAQGSNIHLASGQEKHLPHEAWHVAQQKQGRVKPTTQVKGAKVNDDKGLEKEADNMGAKAVQMKAATHPKGCGCDNCSPQQESNNNHVSQLSSTHEPVQFAPCSSCGETNGHKPNCKLKIQEDRGLVMSKGMELHGASMGRVPHGKGGVASAGSSREATHSHGNKQAKTQAINKLVSEGVDRHKITSSSQVRGAIRGKEKDAVAREKREEKRQAKKVVKKSDEEMTMETFGFSALEWERMDEEERIDHIRTYRENFKDKEEY